ncbi:MAG: peptide deformylase [Spirochaetia bacterium]|nr:peptide deformylase [Spirochaetia bacterium]
MSVRKIITISNKILYQESEIVTKFDSKLRALIRDMFDTMHEEHGVGLAAVQIGVLTRAIVIDLEKSGFAKGTFINPEIIEQSDDMEENEEGCLSIPGVTANLKRPKSVKISYQNIFGDFETKEAEGLFARALCHEIDHINGKVFIDQLDDAERSKVEEDILEVKGGRMPLHFQKPAYRS